MKLAQDCLEELIQNKFVCDSLKTECIVFIHTHGRNGSYNPLSLSPVRLLWQKHLLSFISAEMGELNFEEVAESNPLKCQCCGEIMEFTRLFHPLKGFFYDIFAPDEIHITTSLFKSLY